MKLIFASSNKNKFIEVEKIIPKNIKLGNLIELNFFDEIPEDALETQPLRIDWTFWCYKCGGMASMKTCPHEAEDRLLLSGTKLRKMLSEGEDPPPEFSRPEVVAILQKYYAGLSDDQNVKIKLEGHSGQ